MLAANQFIGVANDGNLTNMATRMAFADHIDVKKPNWLDKIPLRQAMPTTKKTTTQSRVAL
ncbi:hypothetical protein GCM10011328_01500 [Hafnia psychrotolerans]|jgi:hypothetical protein|uniref:Uncharacterized protein n=1 Tax=Hafnia psychrotolerans TaxID=1477018 RepID=A0ABQ1FW50_9GAMM|nr:hypothetical protein GCM10011328_01500 [Hafnia psychrotolerans]